MDDSCLTLKPQANVFSRFVSIIRIVRTCTKNDCFLQEMSLRACHGVDLCRANLNIFCLKTPGECVVAVELISGLSLLFKLAALRNACRNHLKTGLVVYVHSELSKSRRGKRGISFIVGLWGLVESVAMCM